jgi:histidinol-phosphate aminotransferase
VALRAPARLAELPRYEPGLTVAEVMAAHGLDRVVKLASNEAAHPPLEPVQRVLAERLHTLNRYPDSAARALRRALAERHGVGPERVVVGNGSAELVMLAGQALLEPGTAVVHAEPSFAVYPLLAPLAGARAVAVPLAADDGLDLEAMADAVDALTRLVIVCNPNNPTGVHRAAAAVERLLERVREDVAVLVDEAYFEFVAAEDAGRVMALAGERANLLVTRTFSKAHGLSALRVGYGVGGTAWIDALDRVRQPFNTNALAQAGALESLRHPDALAERVAEVLAERARVEAGLRALRVGFTPSRANFILLDPGSEGGLPGPATHRELLIRGIVVRDGASLGCPGRLRVTVGAPAENTAFLAALEEIRGALPSTPEARIEAR